MLTLILAIQFAAAWFADTGDTSRISAVVPRGLAPLYDKPVPGALPISYLETADTCLPGDRAVDSTGTDWVALTCGNRKGWVRKSSVRSALDKGGESKARLSSVSILKKDPDAKRRYRILEKHRDWPRRIIKAVREGKICLDMNERQLAAAWGEPYQKGSAFILGVGSQNLWFYHGSDGTDQVVFLVKHRVVGWSEKE